MIRELKRKILEELSRRGLRRREKLRKVRLQKRHHHRALRWSRSQKTGKGGDELAVSGGNLSAQGIQVHLCEYFERLHQLHGSIFSTAGGSGRNAERLASRGMGGRCSYNLRHFGVIVVAQQQIT